MLTYLIGAGLGLLGAVIFNLIKGSNAEATLKNLTVRQEVSKIQDLVNVDQANLDAEAKKRADLEAQAKAQENKNDSEKDLVDFVNKLPPSNK